MTAFEPISRTISFIEDSLRTTISVADMAEVAAYSLYHFCRVFGKFTRHTPYDYLMRRRMTLAAQDVVLTERKIVDIAMDYQFESHEGFTRAFQRIMGAAPTQARRQRSIMATRRLTRLTDAHLHYLQQQKGMIPTFTMLPNFSSGRVAFWARFDGKGCPCNNLSLQPGEIAQITIPPTWPALDDSGVASSVGTDGEYARFSLTEKMADLPLALDWILHAWLFYAPYQLRQSEVLIQREEPGHLHLYVPVQRDQEH